MSLLSREDFMTLMGTRPGWHVSLYSPIHRAGVETLQNPVRCRNLLRQAEGRLLASGQRPQHIAALLEPAHDLLADYDFWQHQEDGLALFLAPDVFEAYRLPLAFDELVVVNQRFHLKPLLPLLSEDGQFYILALSQNHIRLLRCTRYSATELELPDVPTSREEALKYNDPERQQQFHTETQPFGPPNSGERGAIFYGTGTASVDNKGLITEYFRLVDRGLHEVLRNEQAPLVLAGVEYLLPLYKQVATYAHVLDAGVLGNPDGLRAQELHAQAWSVVEPLFRQHREDAAARYRRYAGTGRAASDLKEVLQASYNGRVETLFVAIGIQQWGTFDPDTQEVKIAREATPEHEDLLDYAALHTFLNSGTVYAVSPDNVPDDAPLAAIMRY
jgi:hypothetical protein